MPTQTTTETAARRLSESPAVAAAIDALVRELREAQSTLVEARGPTGDLVEPYEAVLKRFGEMRGRPPLYPYLGSGLGNGPLVELADGSVKWDMINGIGVHMFGHGDPDLTATALRAALADTVMQGNLQCNADAVAFAELLLAEASGTTRLAHCFLTNSGTMANESALKVCLQRREGRAPRVLAFSGCFMGRSTTMAQIGDSPGNRVGIPLNVHVDYMPFFDPEQPERSTARTLDDLRRVTDRYPGQHACFVIELIQGEGGFNVAPRAFLEPLMELCREREIAVWADEVQTFGRTRRLFHFDELGLGPLVDVVTIGKMSQVCACLYTADYNPKPGLLSGTFIGSTAGLQVGRRGLQRLLEGGYYGEEGRIATLFRVFCEHARALVEKHPEWFPPVPHPRGAGQGLGFFGGTGGMMRFSPFGGEKAPIMSLLQRLYERGVIAFYCGHGPYHVRFLPPVGVMQPEQFVPIFEIVEAAMADVHAGNG